MLYYRFDEHTPHWRADRKERLAAAIRTLVANLEPQWGFADGAGPYVDVWGSGVTIRKMLELDEGDREALTAAADAIYVEVMRNSGSE